MTATIDAPVTTEGTNTTTVTPVLTREMAVEACQRINNGEFQQDGDPANGWSLPTEPNSRGDLPTALVTAFRQHTIEQMEAATSQQIKSAIEANGYTFSTDRSDTGEFMRRGILAVLGEAKADTEVDTTAPATKAERTALAERIIRESAWSIPVFLTGYYGEAGVERWDKIVETLVYQFNNWCRGVYVQESASARYEQFNRRLVKIDNEGNPLTSRSQRIIKTLLGRMHEAAKGTVEDRYFHIRTDDTSYWSDLAKRWRGEDGTEQDQGVGRGHNYWGSNDASYYLAAAIENWNSDIHYGSVVGDDREWNSENVRKRIDQYTGNGRADGYTERLEQFIDHVAGIIDPAPVAVVEVATAEEFITLLLSKEQNLPDFYVAAITNGTLDFVDRIREKEDVGDPVNTLRREVRKYGYLKFSGKGLNRRVLNTAIASLTTALGDQPLTVEEWKARHERFKQAVQYVSGRYGEVQGMCPVLEKATGELGLDPIRRPKRIARMEGDGLVVDVEVETWRDTTNGLIDVARDKWNTMTTAEREASVVSRTGVYVNWSNMRSLL